MGNNNFEVGSDRAKAEALAKKAVELGKQHQVEQMFASAEQACALDPTYFGGYAMRGRILAQRGQLPQALVDFELANDLAVGEGRVQESQQLFGLQGFLQQVRQQMNRRADELWRAAGSKDSSSSQFSGAPEAQQLESLLQAPDAASVLAHAEAMVAARTMQSSPLFMAAQQGRAQVAERLLRAYGAAVDTRWESTDEGSTDGPTALIQSAMNGHSAVVRVLLAGGAAVEATNAHGMTAMAFALKDGRAEVVQLLLDAGASADHVRMTTKGPWCRSLAEVVGSLSEQGQSHAEVVRVLRAHAGGRAAEPPVLGPCDQSVTRWDPSLRKQVPVELRAGAMLTQQPIGICGDSKPQTVFFLLLLLLHGWWLTGFRTPAPDPQDGFKLFSMAGFVDFYSGTAEWDAAAGVRQ
jgi:hypothetical protein